MTGFDARMNFVFGAPSTGPFGLVPPAAGPARETRQTRRAAAREHMRGLDRKGRVIEKKIAIASLRLRQANKALGQ